MAQTRVPTAKALSEFGLAGRAIQLAGGQGNTWRVGDAVMKPLDMEIALLPWQGDLLTRLDGRSDFRVSPPLRARDGGWVVEGWTAWRNQATEISAEMSCSRTVSRR